MASKIDDKALGTFELIDVYDTGSREDLERLVSETHGEAREEAERMLGAYDAYIDSVRAFYDRIVVPAFEEGR